MDDQERINQGSDEDDPDSGAGEENAGEPSG